MSVNYWILWFLPLYYYLCYTILCPCKLKDHQTEKENAVWQRAHTHPATVNVFDLSYTVAKKKDFTLIDRWFCATEGLQNVLLSGVVDGIGNGFAL